MSDAWSRAEQGRNVELYRRGLRRVESEADNTYRVAVTALTSRERELGWVLARREILERLKRIIEVSASAMAVLQRLTADRDSGFSPGA